MNKMKKMDIDKNEFFEKEFEEIINLLNFSYGEIINKKIYVKNKSENEIKNLLLEKYIYPEKENFNLIHLLFLKEGQPNNENENRADIIIYNFTGEIGNEKKYLVIECKKLYERYKTSTSLKKHYFEEGVQRFLKKKYKSPFNKSIMLSFIILKFTWIEEIKKYFEKIYNIENKKFEKLKPFKTKHEKSLEIYHLFMDFTKMIKLKKSISNSYKIKKKFKK